MKNLLENPVYQEPPKSSNMSIYPTIIDIIEAIAEWEENNMIPIDPHHPTVLNQFYRPGKHMVVAKEVGSNEICTVPISRIYGTWFRGQSCYYNKCIPSVYRNYSDEKKLLSDLQFQEFKLLLKSHPVIKDQISSELIHKEIKDPIKLPIIYEGLAQHYGIATNLLDFTNDKWTGAFFATTVYDEKSDTYSPKVDTQDSYGVYYIYTNDSEKDDLNIEPIGLHYFNRPGAQNGFALKLNENEDLNNLKNVKKIFFKHDEMASKTVFSMNQKGRKLFPDDHLVKKVKLIMSKRKFSLTAINNCKAESYSNLSDDEFRQLLKKYEIESSMSPIVTFSDDSKVSEELNYWQREGKERYKDSLWVPHVIMI